MMEDGDDNLVKERCMKTIVKLLFVACGLWIAAQFVPGITVDAFWPTAVIAAVVLGVISAVALPIVKLLALPVTILTLGIFSLVLTVLGFWILTLVPGVQIDGFLAAFAGLVIVTVFSWAADLMTK